MYARALHTYIHTHVHTYQDSGLSTDRYRDCDCDCDRDVTMTVTWPWPSPWPCIRRRATARWRRRRNASSESQEATNASTNMSKLYWPSSTPHQTSSFASLGSTCFSGINTRCRAKSSVRGRMVPAVNIWIYLELKTVTWLQASHVLLRLQSKKPGWTVKMTKECFHQQERHIFAGSSRHHSVSYCCVSVSSRIHGNSSDGVPAANKCK